MPLRPGVQATSSSVGWVETKWRSWGRWGSTVMVAVRDVVIPLALWASQEKDAVLFRPGTRSVCWGLWSMAEARETASWSQRRSTGSGVPAPGSSG